MATRLVLVPEGKDTPYGVVKPVQVGNGGSISYGLSIGTWSVSGSNGNIYIDLVEDVDTIIHETATRKGVRVELRVADRDARGVEKKPTITYDPRTKRFGQVYQ